MGKYLQTVSIAYTTVAQRCFILQMNFGKNFILHADNLKRVELAKWWHMKSF